MVSQADLISRRDEVRRWYPNESTPDMAIELCLTEDEAKQFKRMERFHGLIHARYGSVLRVLVDLLP